MSIGGSIAQILCVAVGIFSLVEFYPIKLIWSVILFFIFGYLGSRFNRKAMMKEMSKVFALKLESSKTLEIRSKYYSMLEQYRKTLNAELAKY
jgi:phosphotransferase system  glucose/maltose/N-acetylglucosamine-specific IIC component